MENNIDSNTKKRIIVDWGAGVESSPWPHTGMIYKSRGYSYGRYRTLKPNEKYFAVDRRKIAKYVYNGFCYKPNFWFHNMLEDLKEMYGDSFGGYVRSDGICLPFADNSVDELHMHWLMTGYYEYPDSFRQPVSTLRWVSFYKGDYDILEPCFREPELERSRSNLAKFLSEAKRVIKTGGELIVSDSCVLLPPGIFKHGAANEGFLTEGRNYEEAFIYSTTAKDDMVGSWCRPWIVACRKV